MRKQIFFEYFLVTLASSQVVNAALYGVPIETEYGTVQGFKYFNGSLNFTTTNNVAAFLGVPYAADTSYQNRWKVAQPREPWNGTLMADNFGPACPIAHQATAGFTLSEDCLSSYGSGETSGEALYDGGGLATKDVVVISYNYRDAAFGFLVHPELSQESGHNSSGNYGILDQLTALQWIKKNIANFGGDPDKIVIGGQSFGSAQVYHAVNSPLFKGSFRGMIAESGIRYPGDPYLAGLADSYKTLAVAEKTGINYTAFHNVSSVAGLRNLSMESLLIGSDDRDYSISNLTALWTSYPPLYKTCLDGYVVPSTYQNSLLNGPSSDVPMITGNNKDESGAATTTNYTVAQYYEYNTANDWYGAASSPFYTYYWDYAPPGQSGGAHHMAEINYVLNNLYKTDLPWGAYDYELADIMSTYWANFIKYLDPNGLSNGTNSSLTQWAPNEGLDDKTVMLLGTGFGMVDIEESRLDLLTEYFNSLPAY
ncbi:related to carboxylesterase type B [Phialocephala subalpina]|uniref:Related to carboxylesterase type B n=1 Tax=Phialocephala subalpina TaxID=576137 RepID=A0A1L7WLR1_9HELO|nr:related to carboxylesterase type B [Phialocephala subalpina]